MSGAHTPMETVGQARADLEEVRRLLICPTPQALDLSNVRLQQAINSLQDSERFLRSEAGPRAPALAVELDEVRRQAFQIDTLLRHAAGFYLGWARLASEAAGYTSQGEPATPEPLRRLTLEG